MIISFYVWEFLFLHYRNFNVTVVVPFYFQRFLCINNKQGEINYIYPIVIVSFGISLVLTIVPPVV